MSKLLGRPRRIVTGPLKTVTEPDRSAVPVVSLALMAAAISAALALMPRLAQWEASSPPAVSRAVVPAPPDVRVISTAAVQDTASGPATAPVSVEPVASVRPASVAAPLVQAAVAVEPAASEAEQPKPMAEASPFQLDALPVLETGGDDLALVPAPQKPVAKVAPRRNAPGRSGSVMASGGPVQN